MMEFKKCPYYPDKEVSKDGTVRSALSGKVLKPTKNKSGYLYLRAIREDGKRVNVKVHRLVLLTWSVVPSNWKDMIAEHLDGDKLNVHISNLAWGTHKTNNKHALDTGLLGYASDVALKDVASGKVYCFNTTTVMCEHLQKSAWLKQRWWRHSHSSPCRQFIIKSIFDNRDFELLTDSSQLLKKAKRYPLGIMVRNIDTNEVRHFATCGKLQKFLSCNKEPIQLRVDNDIMLPIGRWQMKLPNSARKWREYSDFEKSILHLVTGGSKPILVTHKKDKNYKKFFPSYKDFAISLGHKSFGNIPHTVKKKGHYCNYIPVELKLS